MTELIYIPDDPYNADDVFDAIVELIHKVRDLEYRIAVLENP